MAWSEPKTNWIYSDYINIDPDYNRIKGNAEYIAEQLGITIDLENANVTTLPRASFFNNVNATVINLYVISSNKRNYSNIQTNYQRDYSGVWDYKELNDIETYLSVSHDIVEILPRIKFMLGGGLF